MGLSIWVGCISSGALHTPSSSVLDGKWREVSVGCVDGPPTPAETRVNEALQSGQVTSNMSIASGIATTDIRTYHNKEKTGGYCDIKMIQRWNEIGSHIEVDDVSIHQKGQDGDKCQGSPEIHDPRVHNFVINGDQLTIFMNSTITINSAGTYSAVKPTECPNGEPQKVIFKKL